MDKAQLERITQLARAAQGKPTKRPVDELLKSERAAAEKYIVRPPPVTAVVEAPQEGTPQT
jgi:hypothetical protein